ncbi:MAG: GTPase Era [Labilithrix sp.]|nr:GTPase Era [Labilithrix sp.]
MPAKSKDNARPRTSEGARPRAGTIALVGRPNVGKSTLLNALLGTRIAITSPHPQTTRDRIAGILTEGGVQFVFLDTPGLHRPRHKLGQRMNELARGAASDSDVAVFVTDVDARPDGTVANTVRDEDREILKSIPETTPTILVLNKIDRVRNKTHLFPLLEAFGKERALAAVIPVSALAGDGMGRVLSEAAKLLPPGEPLFDPDELSDKPLRFFVAELVREQVLRRTRQEVPHGVAVTVESFEEGTKDVRISVTVHVAKESHKGIIIGDGGKMLASIGTAARKRAEALIGRKVHLQTFVRATPKWFDDEARLTDMGVAEGAKPKARKARKGRGVA